VVEPLVYGEMTEQEYLILFLLLLLLLVRKTPILKEEI
jgi:hypothetical protein